MIHIGLQRSWIFLFSDLFPSSLLSKLSRSRMRMRLRLSPPPIIWIYLYGTKRPALYNMQCYTTHKYTFYARDNVIKSHGMTLHGTLSHHMAFLSGRLLPFTHRESAAATTAGAFGRLFCCCISLFLVFLVLLSIVDGWCWISKVAEHPNNNIVIMYLFIKSILLSTREKGLRDVTQKL